MSSLVSHIRLGPHGKNDECSKFIISDIREEFTIFGVMTPGEKYTLSFWVCSDAEGSLIVGNRVTTTSSEWEKRIIQFEATGEDLVFDFEAPATYYIYHPKLETGTLSTDWTPAPEDHDQLVSDTANQTNKFITEQTNQTNKFVEEQTNAVLGTTQAMVADATGKLVPKDEFESFERNVEARFAVQSDEITMQFGTARDLVAATNNDLNNKFSELYKYIQFDENGITIGSGDSAITLELDNKNGIIFKKNGVQFGWWDGVDFHTGNIFVEVQYRAQFGNFAFIPRTDGSLSLLKVGG